jgi:hypothetical protein
MATLEARLTALASAVRDKFNAAYKGIVASEAISAGDYVNVWNDSGTAKVRKASATAPSLQAHGFAKATAASGALVQVAFFGINSNHSGLTPGLLFLSTTPGAATSTPPSVAGQVVQRIGVAVSATEAAFTHGLPITLS